MQTYPPDPSSEAAREHRRHHRMGVPSKLACDPELRAFVEARLSEMTFHQIAEAVVDSFPADRRVSASAIYRWWCRLNGKQACQ